MRNLIKYLRNNLVLIVMLGVFAVSCNVNGKYKTEGKKTTATILSKFKEDGGSYGRKKRKNTFDKLEVSFSTDENAISDTVVVDKKHVDNFLDNLGKGIIETPANYYKTELTVSKEFYEKHNVGDKIKIYYLIDDPTSVRLEEQVEEK